MLHFSYRAVYQVIPARGPALQILAQGLLFLLCIRRGGQAGRLCAIECLTAQHRGLCFGYHGAKVLVIVRQRLQPVRPHLPGHGTDGRALPHRPRRDHWEYLGARQMLPMREEKVGQCSRLPYMILLATYA